MSDVPKNPAHWEGSQYLLEKEPVIDPVTGKKLWYRYTEAAARTQVRKWKRLMANRPPRTTIPPEMLATGYNDPPVLLFGWPFKDNYFVDYAKHHRISFETDAKHQEWLGCPTLEFNFADVTEAHYERKNVVNYLRYMARTIVIRKFLRATGQWLRIGQPLSFKYSKILYMWTNYDMDEEYNDFGRPDRYPKVFEFLDTAMNECLPEGQKTKLQWWWCWNQNRLDIFKDME